MTRKVLLLVVALGALRDPCGTDSGALGVNAPCTRSKDCENGLSCVDGVCSPGDAGAPEAGQDAGDAASSDGGAVD